MWMFGKNSDGKVMFSCGDAEHVWFSQPNCAPYDTMPGKKKKNNY